MEKWQLREARTLSMDTQLIMGQSWGSGQVPNAASLQPEEGEAIPCPLDSWN